MGGTAIIGIDGTDEAHIAQALTEQDVLTVQTVSVRDQAASLQYEGGRLLSQSGDVYRLDHLSVLPGRHNAQNAGLAILAGHALGVGHEDIQRGLESFHGLAHRLQPVAKAGKVLFVNDSKATNAEACVHALHAYDHIHWIAGGLAKSSGLAGVESALSHVSHAYLIGDAAQEFSGFLSAHGVAHQVDETLERAVHAAAKGAAAEGEAATVLLSPACASFDQFPNFEARGDAFCALVNTLVGAARDSETMQ